MSDCQTLLMQLISRPSITPDDAGCQDIIRERLTRAGFQCEDFNQEGVTNLWARYGRSGPLLVFAGHTDVVPTGPLDAWTSDPFTPVIRDGLLYGRGATDMKSGLAAMIVAAEQFIAAQPTFKGSIAFLITSDEEGPAVHGTRAVMEHLTARGEKIDYCIVGEATAIETPGDRIRIGRRGSLHGQLMVKGVQGHIAFPEKCRNPIHLVAPAIHALATTHWDEGDADFPPTTFQISNIHAGTGTTNIVPGMLELLFNFRFSPAVTIEALQKRVSDLLYQHQLEFSIEWNCSAAPFLTRGGKLIAATQEAIQGLTGRIPEQSTGGGTSDGRFIAPTGAEVIELGPCATSAHAIDEHVRVDHLESIRDIYRQILKIIFS